MIGAGTVLTPSEVDAVARRRRHLHRLARHQRCGHRGDARRWAWHPTRASSRRPRPSRAIRAGATGLKFFPAEVLGPKGIKAMKAVLPPALPLYAVGGANPDNFRDYFDAGCAGFGLGTYIYKPGMTLGDIADARPSRRRRLRQGEEQE